MRVTGVLGVLLRAKSQPGALGRGASVSLVQQNQIRREFQGKRHSLGLTAIECACEQPRNLVFSKCLRFDPTVLLGE